MCCRLRGIIIKGTGVFRPAALVVPSQKCRTVCISTFNKVPRGSWETIKVREVPALGQQFFFFFSPKYTLKVRVHGLCSDILIQTALCWDPNFFLFPFLFSLFPISYLFSFLFKNKTKVSRVSQAGFELCAVEGDLGLLIFLPPHPQCWFSGMHHHAQGFQYWRWSPGLCAC